MQCMHPALPFFLLHSHCHRSPFCLPIPTGPFNSIFPLAPFPCPCPLYTYLPFSKQYKVSYNSQTANSLSSLVATSFLLISLSFHPLLNALSLQDRFVLNCTFPPFITLTRNKTTSTAPSKHSHPPSSEVTNFSYYHYSTSPGLLLYSTLSSQHSL